MNDPRASTALRQLDDLADGPGPPRWMWAVVAVEPTGRIVLPRVARDALGVAPGRHHRVRGICHQAGVMLGRHTSGAVFAVDGRGRMRIPAWLSRGGPDLVLVGSHPATGVVVIAPTAILDSLGDSLAAGERP